MLNRSKRSERGRKPKMPENLIAKSSVQINNTVDEAWKALVNPEIVEKYMLGSQQLSDWRKGSSIKWKKDLTVESLRTREKYWRSLPKKA
jgi:carbon monoxide dehydrogenase subunit G